MRQVEAQKSNNQRLPSPLCFVLPKEMSRVGWSRLASVSLLLAVSLLGPATSAMASERPTLRTLRQKYQGQRVVVIARETTIGLPSWREAKEISPGRYRQASDPLPVTYNGKEATIIAVQLHQMIPELESYACIVKLPSCSPEPTEQRQNVFGETVGDDAPVDASIDIVVRFDDGMVGVTSRYPGTIEYNMDIGSGLILVSVRDRHAQLMSEKLPSIVGKKLYAVKYSYVSLYEVDTTLEDLTDSSQRVIKRMHDVPLLQPLTILQAKHIEELDLVVLKLRLPDGREAVVASEYRDEGEKILGSFLGFLPPNHDSFLARIAGYLLTAIPVNLTSREVEAIRKGSLFYGMTREAVIYALGFPDPENDLGLAGKQLIFNGGRTLVYLDVAGRVTDFQRLGR